MASSISRLEITNRLGLHLRAASQLVELARQFQADVRLSCNGRTANGRSVVDLMMLAAAYGTPLELQASGPEAAEASAALSALIEARFHEDEDGPDGCPGS